MSTRYYAHYHLLEGGWQSTSVSTEKPDGETRPDGTLVTVILGWTESDWSMSEIKHSYVEYRTADLEALQKALEKNGVPGIFAEHTINADEVQTYEIGKRVQRPFFPL